MITEIESLYCNKNDISKDWMDRLFPRNESGCINFGYWQGFDFPIALPQRLQSQKNLYFELFKRIQGNPTIALEIGSGRGHGVYWLNQEGYSTYGIDLLPEHIALAQANYPSLQNHFSEGLAHKIPFSSSNFDLIYTVEAIQHFPLIEQFCKESHRVLKTGGQLLITSFFLTNEIFRDQASAIIPTNAEGLDQVVSINHLVSLLTANGFELLEDPISIGDYVFPYYAAWQKQQMSNVLMQELSLTRSNWADYYMGGGGDMHPWYKVFANEWIDYYIINCRKTDHGQSN